MFNAVLIFAAVAAQAAVSGYVNWPDATPANGLLTNDASPGSLITYEHDGQDMKLVTSSDSATTSDVIANLDSSLADDTRILTSAWGGGVLLVQGPSKLFFVAPDGSVVPLSGTNLWDGFTPCSPDCDFQPIQGAVFDPSNQVVIFPQISLLGLCGYVTLDPYRASEDFVVDCTAGLAGPTSLTLTAEPEPRILLADPQNDAVSSLVPAGFGSLSVEVVVGGSTMISIQLNEPHVVASAGNFVYIGERSGRLIQYDLSTTLSSVLVGEGATTGWLSGIVSLTPWPAGMNPEVLLVVDNDITVQHAVKVVLIDPAMLPLDVVGIAVVAGTLAPPTSPPPTAQPTTLAPLTPAPTTAKPPTPAPTTLASPTPPSTTSEPSTPAPTTLAPPTPASTTSEPSTAAATTLAPPTPASTTSEPSTLAPPTSEPSTTQSPAASTTSTNVPSTGAPTVSTTAPPDTRVPTTLDTTPVPTPTVVPQSTVTTTTEAPSTGAPRQTTGVPTTSAPETTQPAPTGQPSSTGVASTSQPTEAPSTFTPPTTTRIPTDSPATTTAVPESTPTPPYVPAPGEPSKLQRVFEVNLTFANAITDVAVNVSNVQNAVASAFGLPAYLVHVTSVTAGSVLVWSHVSVPQRTKFDQLEAKAPDWDAFSRYGLFPVNGSLTVTLLWSSQWLGIGGQVALGFCYAMGFGLPAFWFYAWWKRLPFFYPPESERPWRALAHAFAVRDYDRLLYKRTNERGWETVTRGTVPPLALKADVEKATEVGLPVETLFYVPPETMTGRVTDAKLVREGVPSRLQHIFTGELGPEVPRHPPQPIQTFTVVRAAHVMNGELTATDVKQRVHEKVRARPSPARGVNRNDRPDPVNDGDVELAARKPNAPRGKISAKGQRTSNEIAGFMASPRRPPHIGSHQLVRAKPRRLPREEDDHTPFDVYELDDSSPPAAVAMEEATESPTRDLDEVRAQARAQPLW